MSLNISVDNTTRVEVTTHHLTHLSLSLDTGLHVRKGTRFGHTTKSGRRTIIGNVNENARTIYTV